MPYTRGAINQLESKLANGSLQGAGVGNQGYPERRCLSLARLSCTTPGNCEESCMRVVSLTYMNEGGERGLTHVD